jgi:hypothetical protein
MEFVKSKAMLYSFRLIKSREKSAWTTSRIHNNRVKFQKFLIM